jgi:protocatechuate 3,4-dioxygenase beta subunit
VVYVGSDKPVAGGSLRIAMVEIYGALDFQEVPLDGNGEFLLARVPLGIARGCTITTADGTRIDAMIPSAVRSAAGGRVAEKVTVSVPWNTKGRSFDYRGRVVDTRGNPVPGARVLVGYELESAVAVRDRGGYANVRESRTGADGQFDVGGLGFASREILVLHPAFPPVEFPLSAGEPLQGVTITVPDPNRLLVRVRDADGKPVPDVEVRALLHHSDTYNNGWWVFGDVLEGLRANPVTDSDGQALVTLIGPGNWYIAARSADESRCGRVPIRWDGSGSNAVDLVLEAPPSLEGRVVDTDGSPVEGARISLQDDLLSGTRGTQTDSAGRFAFAGVAVAPALGVNAGCARLFLDWDPRFHPALPGVEFLDAVPGTPVEWMVERTQVK